MKAIEKLREHVSGDYFTDTTLSHIFGDGDVRDSKVYRLISSGRVVRLKNGAYTFSKLYQHKAGESDFYIANMLYGPSYVSLESALSWYQLIPEGVFTITSTTTGRRNTYDTPRGRFSYHHIPTAAFGHGVVVHTTVSTSFLVATREKALLDKLYLQHHDNDYFAFCTQSLRIERDELASLNIDDLLYFAGLYGNRAFASRVTTFVDYIRGTQ